MTRLLLAFLALLGLAVQAPASARVIVAQPAVGCVAPSGLACHHGSATVAALVAAVAQPTGNRAARQPQPAPKAVPAPRAPVLPGIDRAHE